jgi:D-glycero-alpha-D-manno-heptose-7-phosphate kinase
MPFEKVVASEYGGDAAGNLNAARHFLKRGLMEIIAKAPTRIDLAGGTLDIWPLYLFFDETVTINAAISLYATAKLQALPDSRIEIISKDQNESATVDSLTALNVNGKLPLITRLIRHFAPDKGFRLETDCLAPAGSGLGGSSSLAIAVSGALNEFTQKGYSREDLIAVCRDIEAQVLGIPTGEQDYYAATYGGLNAWRFRVQNVERESYSLALADLQERIVLFYTGQSRNSGLNNWKVFKSCIDGEPQIAAAFRKIKEETLRLHSALKSEDWGEAYEAIHGEWMARKELAPTITTPEIEELIEFGITNGSRTGRVCGAGGGGCVVFIIDSFTRPYLCDLAKERGYNLLSFELVSDGLTIETK